MKDVIGADVVPENKPFLFANFDKHHVDLRPGAKVSEFFTDGVSYALADGTEGELRGFDNIILAMGSRSYNPLEETVKEFVPEVIVIGEAVKSSWQRMHLNRRSTQRSAFTLINKKASACPQAICDKIY